MYRSRTMFMGRDGHLSRARRSRLKKRKSYPKISRQSSMETPNELDETSTEYTFSEADTLAGFSEDETVAMCQSMVKNRPSTDSMASSRTSHNGTRKPRCVESSQKQNSRPTSKLEEQITNESLKRLQKMFEEADEDGGGGLDIEEFTKAMQKTMPGLDEHELELIFMKVDTNCDGTVDWDEYLSYMLLEYKEKDQMTSLMQDKPFPKHLRDIQSSHRDDITDVGFIPTLNRRDHWVDGIDYHYGRYVTVSKDGIVNFWSIDMHHLKSHVLEYARENTLWITAMVPMPNMNMLAIASTEREISLFDINANKFDRQYRITGMDDCVLCMDFWFNNRNTNEAVLVWGDVGGSISAIVFSECMTGGSLFANRHDKQARNNDNGRRIAFAELLVGNVKGIQAYRLKKIHQDWVCQVRYYHTLDAFISCSAAGSTCMYMGDFQRRKIGYYFTCRKGILCFDYDKTSNIIVTGGMDHLVRIWNPYVTAKSIVVLKGHVKAVVHVILNSRREQIISIAKDKAIRVFNMADQCCAQYIPGHKIPMGTHIISSIFFNPVTQTLLLASNQLAILEKGEDRQVEISSHDAPVCAALYNKLFGQLVSACLESMVCVWDVSTGEKVIQFTNAHFRVNAGEITPIEITAMTFDPTGRRLMTGARDGSLKIWNFNNGACLRELMTMGGLEITGIVCPRDRIVVTGWNRRVTIYMDAKDMEDEIPRIWNAKHEEDIQAIAFNGNSNLATSSYDGDVILWSIETGQPLCKMNAHTASKPLTSIVQMKLRPKLKRGRNDIRRIVQKPGDVFSDDSSSVTSSQRKAKTAGPTRDVKAGDGRETASARQDSPRNVTNEWMAPDDCDTSVDKLLFLTERENDIGTATIFTGGADGWVRAWSIHHKGGLLGQFVGVHNPGSSISAMLVNSSNELLFTGDSEGYIKTWDISDYCISKEQLSRLIPLTQRASRTSERRKPFSFPVFHKVLKTLPKFRFNPKRFPKPPETSDPERTIKAPFLLNSYRAHVKPITHIEYLEDRGLVATSSADCSVRMWTISGRFIGTFGQAKPWSIKEFVDDSMLPVIVPTDVSRVASTATMQVLKPGTKNNWAFARNILLLATKLSLKSRGGVEEEEERKETPMPCEKGECEPILGKYYRSRIRHKMMPKLPPIKHCHNQVSVYSSLPFSELLPIQQDRTVNRIIVRHRSFNPGAPEAETPAQTKFGPKVRNLMRRQTMIRAFMPPGGMTAEPKSAGSRRRSSVMSAGTANTLSPRRTPVPAIPAKIFERKSAKSHN